MTEKDKVKVVTPPSVIKAQLLKAAKRFDDHAEGVAKHFKIESRLLSRACYSPGRYGAAVVEEINRAARRH